MCHYIFNVWCISMIFSRDFRNCSMVVMMGLIMFQLNIPFLTFRLLSVLKNIIKSPGFLLVIASYANIFPSNITIRKHNIPKDLIQFVFVQKLFEQLAQVDLVNRIISFSAIICSRHGMFKLSEIYGMCVYTLILESSY